jgi:hypothetical protein
VAGKVLCALSLALVPFALGACAAAQTYAGVPLTPGAADRELQELARRAKAGDKHAQLELGIRYEEGRGVPINLRRAAQLYLRAGTSSGGTRYIPAAPGRRGRAGFAVRSGAPVAGLPEALARLRRMQRRR